MTENMQLAGKRISVVGAGVSGRALAELAAELGADVFVSDIKEPDAAAVKGFEEKGIKWKAAATRNVCLRPMRSLSAPAFRPRLR